MDGLNEIKKELCDISFFDKISSKFFKFPLNSFSPCSAYSDSLEEFIDSGVYIKEISRYRMTLVNMDGKAIELWIANYPYHYGYSKQKKTPSWRVIFKLRKIQLSMRDKVICDYIRKNQI